MMSNMHIQITKTHKSIHKGSEFDLPEFTVITGKNGSGKTHLLQALNNRQNSTVSIDDRPLSNFQLVSFGGFSAAIGNSYAPSQLDKIDGDIFSHIELVKQECGNPDNPEDLKNTLRRLKGRIHPQVSEIILCAVQEGISLNEIQMNDISRLSNIESNNDNKNMFSENLAELFCIYNSRIYENEFQNYMHLKDINHKNGLSDDEFVTRHGQKPWEIINSILKTAHLPYQFIPPTIDNCKIPYKLKLIDADKDTNISVSDLSTGEKVLLALGVSIFRNYEDGWKPDVLLLDEPDAPLHPEFSLHLVNVLRNVIVKKAGVRVIFTTHSPSTLAVCPDESIFVMNRETSRPESVSQVEAIRALTQGVPHLRVSSDYQRQVFVENKNDADYYHDLFDALKVFDAHENKKSFDFEPYFLATGNGTTNCTDVIDTTNKLSENGNDLIRGIIDYDNNKKHINNFPVFVFGNGTRYTIENYILDPLFVALALINIRRKKFSDFGVESKHSYIDARDLTTSEVQMISDSLLSLVGINSGKRENCILENNFEISHPTGFLYKPGHEWEDLIIKKIPELNELMGGHQEDSKLKKPILKVIQDIPQFLPKEIRETFESLE